MKTAFQMNDELAIECQQLAIQLMGILSTIKCGADWQADKEALVDVKMCLESALRAAQDVGNPPDMIGEAIRRDTREA